VIARALALQSTRAPEIAMHCCTSQALLLLRRRRRLLLLLLLQTATTAAMLPLLAVAGGRGFAKALCRARGGGGPKDFSCRFVMNFGLFFTTMFKR